MSTDQNTSASAEEVDRLFSQALDEALDATEGVVVDPLRPFPGTRGPRMTEKFEPESLSHTHEAVMNWMIAHPSRPLRECAQEFGYSQSWLSILIHSDVFQARMREKHDQLFSMVGAGITDKLGALADITVDKLSTMAESSSDPKFLLEASKMALANLGFTTSPGRAGANNNINANNVQQNFYVASPADLSAAREQMRIAGTVSTSNDPGLPSGDAPLMLPPATGAAGSE